MSYRVYWVCPVEGPSGEELPIGANSFKEAVTVWYNMAAYHSDETSPKAGEKYTYTLRVTDTDTCDIRCFTATVSAVVEEVE